MHDDEKTLSLMEKYSKPKKITKRSTTKPKKSISSKSSSKTRNPIASKRFSGIRSFFIKTLSLLCAGMLVFFGAKYLYDHTINYNPLIGTWRAKTIMGIMEISFDRESISNFGTQRTVNYDVKEKEVIVMDSAIKIGESYQIIDEDTISTQSGASKIIFKRVK